MKLLLTPYATEDLAYWHANDSLFADKIRRVLRKLRDGKPLPRLQIINLSLNLKGLIAIRLSAEHRIVFERLNDDIIVHQCRFHY